MLGNWFLWRVAATGAQGPDPTVCPGHPAPHSAVLLLKRYFPVTATQPFHRLIYKGEAGECLLVVQLLSQVRLCDPTGCSTPGSPVLHFLPEFAQIHVH